MGYSEWTDAETLAWSEAYILFDYLHFYHVTGDERWLRKITVHFDEMIGNMSDHDGDGYKGWQTDRYCLARVMLTQSNSAATLTPTESWIQSPERSHLVTGHTYRVTVIANLAYAIQDLDTGQWLVTSKPLSSLLTGIPEVTLKLSGVPSLADSFVIKTTRPVRLEHMVHEGILLLPVAKFIEIAAKNPNFSTDLKAKAQSYYNLILSNFVPKWEECWREYPGGIGTYAELDRPERWGAGLVLPHNQYLMHADVYLHLDSVSPNPQLRAKSEKMFKYFRSRLIASGSGWTWYYRDVYQDSRRTGPIEDASHGGLDVLAMIDAYKHGMVFSEADIIRLANTFTQQMWNGSLSSLDVGDYVNSKSGPKDLYRVRFWSDLSQFSPTAFNISRTAFDLLGRPLKLIGPLVEAQAHASGTIASAQAVQPTSATPTVQNRVIRLETTAPGGLTRWNTVAPDLLPTDPDMLQKIGSFGDSWMAFRWDTISGRWEPAQPLSSEPTSLDLFWNPNGSVTSIPVSSDPFTVGKGWMVALRGSGAPVSIQVSGTPINQSTPYAIPLERG